MQVVREEGTTENTENARPVTIDQNLPDEEVANGSGQSSSENSERREEMTNYEINEKKVSLVSDGYMVENMSVAVLVNRSRLNEVLGENPDQAVLDEKLAELEQIVAAAISSNEERGDRVTVKLVEFMPVSSIEEGGGSNAALGFLAMHFGSMLNALGAIVGAILFAMLGIRPVLAFLSKEPATTEQQGQLAAQTGTMALAGRGPARLRGGQQRLSDNRRTAEHGRACGHP